jgi:predicted transcriptional regulator
MPKHYSYDQVMGILKKRQGERTQKELADDLGVSQQYLCDVFAGKRFIGERVLSALGMYREWAYYIKKDEDAA